MRTGRSAATWRSAPDPSRPGGRRHRSGRRCARRRSAADRPDPGDVVAHPVVDDHHARPPVPLPHLLERVGKRVARGGGVQQRQHRLGVRGQRRAATGCAQRLGDPPAGPAGQYGAAPDQRLGLGQPQRQVLGRVLGDVQERRAVLGHLVHRVGDRFGGDLRAETHPAQAGQGHDHRSQRVAGLGGQQDGLPGCGVLGDRRDRRAGHDQLTAPPDGLPDRTDQRLAAALGGEHHDEIERADPARQPGPRPGHERYRAVGLQQGPDQPCLGADGDHRARPGVVVQATQGQPGLTALLPESGPGAGQSAQHLVSGRHARPVVQRRVVEDASHACFSPAPRPVVRAQDWSGRRASSISSTGMPSRTG